MGANFYDKFVKDWIATVTGGKVKLIEDLFTNRGDGMLADMVLINQDGEELDRAHLIEAFSEYRYRLWQ